MPGLHLPLKMLYNNINNESPIAFITANLVSCRHSCNFAKMFGLAFLGRINSN